MFRVGTAEHSRQLEYWGFTKIGRLDDAALAGFIAETRDLVRDVKQTYRSGELLSLINSRVDYKRRSNELVGKYLNPFLARFVDTEEVDVFPVSHILKPFGLKGHIYHQDSCIVNEPAHASLNAWVPLTDTHRLNGCMWMLPGSHIFPHYARPFGINPYNGHPVMKEIKKRLVPVPCRAGEVLVFHRCMLHGSSRNFIPRLRVAAESVIVPKNVSLVQYRIDHAISEDKILRYHVDREHFMRSNPKADFAQNIYTYDAVEKDSREQIIDKLSANFGRFAEHAAQYDRA